MLCRYGRYKHVHTFLSITLLIFNGFSIRKKFWTAENQSFLTIPNIHACRYCRYRHQISNAFNAMLCQYGRYKHVHTFLSITLLIFNGFSIQKKFWTAENQSFLIIPNMHACRYCRYRHKISNAFNAMLCQYGRYKHVHTFLSITLLIFNGFSIRKKFWTAENQSFLTIPNIHACRYCRYRHKISNAFNAMDVDTVDAQWFELHCVS